MTIFPTLKVDEVCSVIVDCVNKTAPKVEGPTPWRMLRTTNIRNGRVDTENCFFVDEDTFAKWTRRATLEKGDTILTREAPVGEVGLVREAEGYFLGQRLMQYRADPAKIDGAFFHFAMRSPFLAHQFRAHGGMGSVVDHLRVPDCKEFLIPLPPRDEQEEIAAILGALDDKIELNRRMSATLEEMARSLYRSWFVDFDPVQAKLEGRAPAHMDPATAALFPANYGENGLPEGWHDGTLDDLIKFNPPERLTKGSDSPYLDMKALPTSGMTHEKPIQRAFTSGTKFRQDDTLLARITPCLENGKTALVQNLERGSVAWGSTEFIVMRPTGVVPKAYPYCVARSPEFRDIAIASMTGSSGRQRADAKRIGNVHAAVPPDDVFAEFASITDPMFDKIEQVGAENQTLATLRDTLLPKLMSGELRVDEGRAQVEEVV